MCHHSLLIDLEFVSFGRVVLMAGFGRGIIMKFKALCGFVVVALLTSNAAASVLPKNVASVKDHFESVGATACSGAISSTLHFLTKGKDFTHNKAWSTVNTNARPIVVDFVISGTKSNYSYSGIIYMVPVDKQCLGTYTTTYVAPASSCMAYIEQHGFDGGDWVHNLSDLNGDGGKTHFLSLTDGQNLNFIFNDVVGGCSVTKRETLYLDAKS